MMQNVFESITGTGGLAPPHSTIDSVFLFLKHENTTLGDQDLQIREPRYFTAAEYFIPFKENIEASRDQFSLTSGGQDLVRKLREASGLTWEFIATLFSVSRRAVHNWESGKSMSSSHQEKLGRILACLEKVPSNNPSIVRKLLLAPISGVLPFDLLKEEKFDVFSKLNFGFGGHPKCTTCGHLKMHHFKMA